MTTESELAGAAWRRDLIQSLIRERHFVRVAELSEHFGVSVVTIRSDLDALEQSGVVRRIRGGAIPVEALSAELRERPFEQAQIDAFAAKERIAHAAVDLIEPGMSVLLDVGTTTAAVAREIVRRESLIDLTVITNGLAIALSLEQAIPRIQVVVTGGTLRPLQHSLVAPMAHSVLESVRVDLAVIGCNGVDGECGVTNINVPEAEIKTAMARAASQVVVVADSSKMGRVLLGRVMSLDEVDVLITDRGADPSVLTEVRTVPALRTITV